VIVFAIFGFMILFDYNSMLAALSFCSAGLALTFFVSWIVSRSDRVLMTWAIGASFLVASVMVYGTFVNHYSLPLGAIAFAALEAGLVLFLGAAHQFRTGVLPLSKMVGVTTAGVAAMAVPMFYGFDGISYIAFNIAAALILFATAYEYWRWRTEAPLLITTLSGLYAFTGVSFLLCAIVLIGDRSWIMDHAPKNWAENLNLIVSLTNIAGIGALSLGLNQVRLTRRHKRDAETDSLTGLFNRRALFERAKRLPATASLIVFDLDHFKQVNDNHGHQTGDRVLQRFGGILTASVRDGDLAARIGGEEFAILLPYASERSATMVAERVRQSFREQRFISQNGHFNSTVSVGVSHMTKHAELPNLIRQADAALYAAKRSGRDLVVLYPNIQVTSATHVSDEVSARSDLYRVVADHGVPQPRPSLRRGRLKRRA
jgi:diguanylate cyclase (GGDEF)-like protein